MIIIELKNNKGFKWFEKDFIIFKGFVFDKSNNIYRNEKIANLFLDIENPEEFALKLNSINGSFSVIIKKNEKVFAAVDTLRSLPLFYIKQNGTFFISDDGWYLIRRADLWELDDAGISEFLLSGYTVGNFTLFNNLQQLQAGQYLYYNNETHELKLDFYYKHLHGNYHNLNKEEYYERLDLLYKNVFSRLIESVQGRPIVIPLSSGYDSRSIAAMLKKLDYKNVICFTYGRPESFEVQTSEKVAKKLEYKWYFINYTDKDDWYKLIRDEKYLFFASNASSLPHIQEYIAISVLKNKSLLPEDAIFVPGFCGDLLGGSYVPWEIISCQERLLFKEGVEDYVFSRYFNLDNKIPIEFIKKIRERISEELQKLGSNNIKNVLDFDSVAEAFFTNHKVSKFVVNALRPYEHFGYEWRMPLWDKELYEFYYKVPLQYRIIGNKIYNDYLNKKLFSQLGIDYRKRSEPITLLRKKFIGYSYISDKIWELLRNIYWKLNPNKKGQIDFNAFTILYEICKEELNGITHSYSSPNNINSIFSLWFIEKFLKLYFIKGNH